MNIALSALRFLIALTVGMLLAVTVVGHFAIFAYDYWRQYVVAILSLLVCAQLIKSLVPLRDTLRSATTARSKRTKLARHMLGQSWVSRERVENIPAARLRLFVFLVCLLAFSIVRGHLITLRDTGTDMGRILSGDEPAYLLITHSLVADADLNLANNLENQDGRYFGAPNADGHCGRIEPGKAYSKHGAGLAFLIAPFYWIGLLLGGPVRMYVLLFLNILVALFATSLFSIVLRVFGSKRLALGTALIVSLAAPIVYYSNHIYPEPVVVLIGIILIKMITFPPARKWLGDLAIGVTLGYLPWLHTKYTLLVLAFVPLAVIERKCIRSWILICLPVAISAGLLMAHLYYCFGSFLPDAAYTYGPREIGTSPGDVPRLFAFTTAAPGLLCDRDYGLLIWSPMYAFGLPGLLLLRRRAPKVFWSSLVFSLIIFLTHAFAPGWHGGWAPPVRHLVPMAGTLGISLAAVMASRPNKLIVVILAVTIALSLGGGYREGTKHLFLRQSRVHYLAARFPRMYECMPVFIPADAVTDRSYLIAFLLAIAWGAITLVTLATAKDNRSPANPLSEFSGIPSGG